MATWPALLVLSYSRLAGLGSLFWSFESVLTFEIPKAETQKLQEHTFSAKVSGRLSLLRTTCRHTRSSDRHSLRGALKSDERGHWESATQTARRSSMAAYRSLMKVSVSTRLMGACVPVQ